MNALFGLMIVAGMIYGAMVDGTFWKIYGVLVVVYLVFVIMQRDAKENPKRKTILMATWSQPSDPTSNIINDYKMDNAMAYVKKLNETQKDVHITMTHIMALGTAWGMYKMRRDVGHLPWGTFKAAKEIGVTILVDRDGGKDLIPVTIWDGHKMDIFEIAKKITERVQRAKKGKDEAHNQSTQMANFIPSFLAQPLMFFGTYVSTVLGIEFKPLGLSSKTFGHIVVTNVGTLGYTSAFAPLCPPVHQLALLCTGAIQKRPIVDDEGNIKVANMMTAVGTGDHRYGDAAIFVPFFATLRGYLEGPETFDPTQYKDNPHYKELLNKKQE